MANLSQQETSEGAVAMTAAAPRFEDALFRVPRKKGKFKVVDSPQPPLEGPVADTHAHLSMVDAPLVLARSAFHQVDFICCITDPTEDSAAVYAQLDGWVSAGRDIAQRLAPASPFPKLRLALGVHPHNAKDYTPEVERQMIQLMHDPRTAAVGEIGLDYHYDLSPREVQVEVFARQLRLAKEAGLPVALHIRQAHAQALEVLDAEGADPANTVLHCCSLSPEELAPWIERGYQIAYGGAYTFKNSQPVREASHGVPLASMMTETDSPYMAPVPLRGADCGPEFTVFTAAAMAEELGFAPGKAREGFLAQLHSNAAAFFDREPTPWQLVRR